MYPTPVTFDLDRSRTTARRCHADPGSGAGLFDGGVPIEAQSTVAILESLLLRGRPAAGSRVAIVSRRPSSRPLH